MNQEHATLYCVCFNCTILQNTPIELKNIHIESGICNCVKCSELKKQQELVWYKRLHDYIDNPTKNKVKKKYHITYEYELIHRGTKIIEASSAVEAMNLADQDPKMTWYDLIDVTKPTITKVKFLPNEDVS